MPTVGKQVRYGDETWEEPILAQMAGLELDDETIGAVVGALESAPRPVKLDRARIDRQMRDLALDHAAGRLEDGVYLDRLRALRDSKEGLVKGRTIVSIRLTPSAYAHGLAVALPTKVALARPTGVGRAISTYTCIVPIEGRDEWLAAAGLQA